MSSESDQDYCASQVRRYDYERYFAAVFARPQARRRLLALYAFNLEIASTRELVTEPLIGEIRLQWWRDTVEAIDAGEAVRDHPVARELAAAMPGGLSRAALDEIIDARVFDLDDEPPEDMAALERYATATAGRLTALAGCLCGAEETAALRAGTAWGLTGLLRALPFHAASGRVFIPRSELGRAMIAPDAARREKERAAVAAAVVPLIQRARALISEARDGLRRLPRDARPAVAYLPVAGAYLDRLEREGRDVFAAGLEPRRLGAQWRTMRAALTGRF